MNLDKKDVQNIADGRIFGGKGLGLIYRTFNSICTVTALAAAVYFTFLNEHSPIETAQSVIPASIQQAPDWLYYLVIFLLGVAFLVNSFLYKILESISKKFVDEWEKTGKLPERKVK